MKKKKNSVTKKIRATSKHLSSIGFSNRLAIYIMLLLTAGLTGGFYLAVKSINAEYTGSLVCWTVAFTPIGTACSIVLSKIVHKSEIENTSSDGDGIKYATARANNFAAVECINSPEI